MELRTLASGSSGNCILLSQGGAHLLIDAGISCKRITDSLRALGLSSADLTGVLITHEHSDHIAGLATLLKHWPLPLYTSPGTAGQLCRRMAFIDELIYEMEPGEDYEVGPFGVSPFATSHDAAQSMGFSVEAEGRRAAVVTDLGYVSDEVLDGVLHHSGYGTNKTKAATLEGQIIRFSDKIAYVQHDIDDSIRAGIITEDDIPVTMRTFLGYTTRERLNTFVHNIIENSMEKDSISMSPDVFEAMMELRALMFRNVYENPVAKKEEDKAIKMLSELYEYYTDHPEAMSREYRELVEYRGVPKEQAVCDYISGMTDQYSMEKFREIYIPKSWEVY